MSDYAAWAQLRALSRQHLTYWEPQWARDELARSSFRRRLRQYQREQKEDVGYAFLIFRHASAELIGGLSLSNVRRGVAQTASVGYWVGAPHAGNGYMTDAVKAIMPYRLRHARAAPAGGGMPAAQCAFHARAGEVRLQARRHGAPLSQDQRRLAGP